MTNPVTTLKKIVRSKPLVDTIKSEATTMNATNWRTSLHGIAVGILMLASIWAPAEYQALITKTALAFSAMGLVTSADAASLRK